MRSLIIGYGEIGKGLYNVLKDHYEVDYLDHSNTQLLRDQYDILHICFGYSEDFIKEVRSYQEKYKPKFTVVHSTVPLGTCGQLNQTHGVVHSPCICQHPFIEEGIRTFTKMLSGKNASGVADYFRRAGSKVALFDSFETTEAAKLFLTEYYRECIEFAQRVKYYCDKFDLNFSEVYRIPNLIYNEGYKKLGYEEFVRPILQPIMTEISGHCVMPNSKLIKLSE